MRFILLASMILWAGSGANSQEVNGHTISSTAAVSNQGGPSMTYTVGEIVMAPASYDSVSVSSGLVYLVDTVSVNSLQHPKRSNHGFLIYPNPTDNGIIIQLSDLPPEAYLEVYTLSGDHLQRIIFGGRDKMWVDFSGYASGIYLLSIMYPNQGTIVSFKIQKN